MRELALNVLDITENSLSAGAKLIEIVLDVKFEEDVFSITIRDDGCGMDEQMLEKVTDPFTTTRTTRSVGMGIPLFKYSAESSGGDFSIVSKKGKGTTVTAKYRIGHIDRMPLGDFGGVVLQLVTMNKDTDFRIIVKSGAEEGVSDTRQIREILGEEISFLQPEIRAPLTVSFWLFVIFISSIWSIIF